jgi:hypothetical protein
MNFSGSIVPQTTCPYDALGWGSFFHVVQTLLSLAVYLGVFLAVLLFAYAGFLFVTNPANPGNIDNAKDAIKNALIGLVIILGAWLLINTVLTALGAGSVSSVTSVLSGGDPCVKITQGTTPTTPATGTPTPTTPTTPTTPSGTVNYVGDAVGEVGDSSGKLSTMLSCMAGKTTFQVTSISDHLITDGVKTFAQCDAGGQGAGCAHTVHSCHYGGTSCVGKSYAADIRNQSDNSAVIAAARACGSTWQGPEADHLHVSIGASCGCN